ncbi:MAG: hypothetical protein ACLFPV_05460 [Spirochaetaceae bacterium]
MTVLDTNVISELMRPEPLERVVDRLDSIPHRGIRRRCRCGMHPLATRNVDDFEHIDIVVINPWEA